MVFFLSLGESLPRVSHGAQVKYHVIDLQMSPPQPTKQPNLTSGIIWKNRTHRDVFRTPSSEKPSKWDWNYLDLVSRKHVLDYQSGFPRALIWAGENQSCVSWTTFLKKLSWPVLRFNGLYASFFFSMPKLRPGHLNFIFCWLHTPAPGHQFWPCLEWVSYPSSLSIKCWAFWGVVCLIEY